MLLLFVALVVCTGGEVVKDHVLDTELALEAGSYVKPRYAEQSTTDGKNTAALFIDLWAKTCGKTKKEYNPWQRVLLHVPHYITDVTFTSTAVTKGAQSTVRVTLYLKGYSVGTCAEFKIAGYPFTRTVSCRGMKADKVQIAILVNGKKKSQLRTCDLRIKGRPALTAEMAAAVNVATGPVAKKLVPKSVDQSSNEGMQYAKFLTDAKGSKTCAQTRKELHPWQRVVLPTVYTIQDVLVMGTVKSQTVRSVTILVNLYNAATGTFVGECGRIVAGKAAFSKTLSCRKMKGSAILLQTLGNHGMAYLRTCNIVVRGYSANPGPKPTPRPNPIAVIHPRGAEQVGTTDKKGANLIIDGRASTCSYTTKASVAWQRVYYDGYHSISSVMIAGSARSTRFIGRNKITIEVNVMKGNQKFGLCGIFQVESGKKYTQNLNCKGFKGDNIRIEVTDGSAYLMTCEVIANGRKA